MDKIIVTKGQSIIIKQELIRDNDLASKVYNLSNYNATSTLGLVTIARIVEGEPYEVEYEFKVGDIVKRNGNLLTIIEGKNNATEETTLEVMNHIGVYNYKLICKAENREDLKGGI